MDKTELFNRIKGKLIISCQALPGEPLYDPERTLMPYMARAAREAGSPMIRANTGGMWWESRGRQGFLSSV